MPRLDALLARNMGWSRTAARVALKAGRVQAADGAALHDPRLELAGERLPFELRVDDTPRMLRESFHLMLHKPVGYVTALRDERYPTAYGLLKGAPLFEELRPAGRLDLDTSGLLIWTTDGPWLQRLTHPKRALPRTYQAALARPFTAPPPNFTLDDGHQPTIQALGPLARADAHPALDVPAETTELATITIVGGAYHEVRRIFAALGSHVLSLCRVSFGRLTLPAELVKGTYREISAGDV